MCLAPGEEASLILHPCCQEQAPIPGVECSDWTSWFSSLASRQQDSHLGIYLLELGYWFPDLGMPQLQKFTHPFA